MPNYTRSESSAETELYLRVFGKKLRNIICFSVEFLVSVFPLDWVSFFLVWALKRLSVFFLPSLNRGSFKTQGGTRIRTFWEYPAGLGS